MLIALAPLLATPAADAQDYQTYRGELRENQTTERSERFLSGDFLFGQNRDERGHRDDWRNDSRDRRDRDDDRRNGNDRDNDRRWCKGPTRDSYDMPWSVSKPGKPRGDRHDSPCAQGKKDRDGRPGRGWSCYPYPRPGNGHSTSTAMEADIEREIVRLMNDERSEKRLSSMSEHDRLSDIADAHSADMNDRNFFGHTNPDKCDPACRADHANYPYRALAENIYSLSFSRGSATQIAEHVVEGWMESSGHRANILDSRWDRTGVGVEVDGDRIYVTALYSEDR